MPRCYAKWIVGFVLCASFQSGLAQGASQEPVERESTIYLVHRSRIALAETNHAAALEFARRAVERDPAYATAWKQLGRVAMLQGRVHLAREALDTAAELRPGDPDVARWRPALFRDLGWAGSASGDWARAIDWFNQALAHPIERRDALLRAAFVSVAESPRPELAAPFLMRWSDANTARLMADELAMTGRWMAAEQAWTAAWQDPALHTNVAPRLLFARLLNNTIRCEEIRPLLEVIAQASAALSQEERDMTCEGVYSCNKAEGDPWRSMIEALTVAPTPLVTDYIERAAQRRLAARNYGFAVQLFNRVFQRDPNRRCYVRAAAALEALRGRSAAIDFLGRVANQSTDEAVQAGALGYRDQLLSKPTHAVKRYDQSLGLDPMQPDVRREYFSVLLSLGRTNEAQAQLAWFTDRLQSGDASTRTPLAEMWYALGRDEEALRFWTELARANPSSPYYAVEQARTLLRSGRTQEALESLIGFTQRVDDARAYELIADIHLASGHLAPALEAIEKGLALEYTPGLLALRARLAEIPRDEK